MSNRYKSMKRRRRNDRKRKKQQGVPGFIAVMGPVLFLPVTLIYLELVFHIYMGAGIKYLPVWICFSSSIGFLFSLLAINFGEKANRIINSIITFIFGLLFSIEMMTKKILAQYYQLFSVASTAADNKLTDYMDAIIKGILENIFGLLLMFLPFIIVLIFGRKFIDFKKKNIKLSVVAAGLFVVAHLLGLAVISLPWKGDYTPSKLYASDTNVDDQVQQLGVITMLRLDLKHSLFGVDKQLDDDFDTPAGNLPSEPDTEEATKDEAGEEQNILPNGRTANTDTSPNIMNVDLTSLADNAPNDELSWLCKYFNSVTPSNKNKYTGMFSGYNVIFITAEGLTGYGISEELTPTLYKLSHEGFVFNNFYTALHYTSTSGGECQNMLGLYPKNGNPMIMKEGGLRGTNWYFSLAQQLNRLGYNSIGFHANGDMYGRYASHTNLGYKWVQDGSGFNMELKPDGSKAVWPQSDLYCAEQTVDQYINSDKPFNVYYVTISGHQKYGFNGENAMSLKNRDAVSSTPYSENTQAYLGTVIELDKAVEYIVDRLEQAGIADKTLIVLSPDHIPYFDVATISELAGKNFASGDSQALADSLDESMITDYSLYKSSLIMWSASMKEPVQVDKICCQVDILPTISNLMGFEYDSRMLSGTDILSDSQPLVAFNSGSWLTDKGYYNRYSGIFTPAAGVSMDETQTDDYVAAMKKTVNNRRALSEIILDNDGYEYIFPGTKNSSSVN